MGRTHCHGWPEQTPTTLKAAGPLLLAAFLFGSLAPAKTIAVGPGNTYATPCQAIAHAHPGDIIEIDARGNYDGDVCAWSTDRLTLRGVHGRARIDAAGHNAHGKGIWAIYAANTTVENIEFSGAGVPDHNGAGIRLSGKNLTVRNCYFHDNEEGILTGDGGEVVIEFCEFARNGYRNGLSHNVYIGHADKLVFRFNYSHDSVVGHLLKSRAAGNYILYNRLSSEQGTTSLELDLPNGGLSYVIGNVIQQGSASQNGGMLGYRLEGPDSRNPSAALFVVNNTFVNQRPGSEPILKIAPSLAPAAVITNNLFVTQGALLLQGANATLRNNLKTASPGFVEPAQLDCRLLETSPAINAGTDPGLGPGWPLAPEFHYLHPACGVLRTQVGAIDIGAYEFGGITPMEQVPDRCREVLPQTQPAIVNAADFHPGPIALGSIFSLFGTDLAPAEHIADRVPLPFNLYGTTVSIGGIAAPLYYVSRTQINAQVPFETPTGAALVTISTAGQPGPSGTAAITETAPHIFVYPDSGRAIAQNSDWSLNAAGNPAQPHDYVTLYLTGQGEVDPPVPAGEPAPQSPLSWARYPYRVTIGGLEAEKVYYFGLAPGMVGVLQATVGIPELQRHT